MASKAKGHGRFPETEWSLVGRAGAESDGVRDEAVAELLRIYRPALRAFLVDSRRIPSELADEVLHDFVADKILARRILERANSERGKFRNFLAKSLSNYSSTKLKREFKQRAKGTALEESFLLEGSPTQDTDRFDQEWVRSVVTDAIELMEADCRDRGREDLWEILRLRAIDPILHEADPVGYDVIVARFDLETPRQAINLLATAKRAFLRHLRVAVGRYVGEEGVDREIADLREIVGR